MLDRSSGFGGAERLAVALATRLDRSAFESHLCFTRPPAREVLDELEHSSVRILELDRSSRVDLAAWRRFRAFLQLEGIDVVHAHKFGSNIWATAVGRGSAPVVIAHEHSWSFQGQALRRLADRELIARRADVVLAVSHADRARMISVEGIDAGRIRVIANAIPPLPNRTGGDVRAELGLVPDAPLVGSVGGLRPAKAYEDLFRAAALLRPEFPELHVAVAGRGPQQRRLEEVIRALGLVGRVTLLGARRDVADVLASLDIAVSSSVSEGSPLAVMEYMAAGKAIVATRVGGVPDLIADGVHGLLVDPSRPEQLAAAIATLLRDPVRRDAMGREARLRQRNEFDLDRMVERLQLLYEELARAAALRAAVEGSVLARHD
jgi:glycosyltransferase involved in cell wall biosynthesis